MASYPVVVTEDAAAVPAHPGSASAVPAEGFAAAPGAAAPVDPAVTPAIVPASVTVDAYPDAPDLELVIPTPPQVTVTTAVAVAAPGGPVEGQFSAPLVDASELPARVDIAIGDAPTVTTVLPTSPLIDAEGYPTLTGIDETLPEVAAPSVPKTLAVFRPDGTLPFDFSVPYDAGARFDPLNPDTAAQDALPSVRKESWLSTLPRAVAAYAGNIDALALAIPKGLIDINLQGDASLAALTMQEWDQLWEQRRSEILRAKQAKQREAARKHARLGWMMPGAVLLAAQATVEAEASQMMQQFFAEKTAKYAEQRVDALWKAQAAFSDYVKFMAQSYATERDRQQKYDEFVKSIADMSAQIQIQRLQASATALQAFAADRQARIAEAMLELETARTNFQRFQLIGEDDKNRVALYQAKASHIQALAAAHSSYVDSVKTYIDGQRAQIEAFSVYLQGIGIELQGDQINVARFEKLLGKAELESKTNDTNVARYGHDVSRFKAAIDLELGRLTSELEAQRLLIQAGTVNAQYYGSAVQAATGKLQADATVFGHEVSGFGAATQFAVNRAQALNTVEIEDAKLRTQAGIAAIEQMAQIHTTNAQLATQAAIATADNATKASLATAEQEARARISTAELTTQASIATAENATRAAIANADRALQGATAEAQYGVQYALGVMEVEAKVGIANADNATKVSIASSENATQANVAAMQTGAQVEIANAENATKVTLANAENSTRVNIANAENSTRAAIAGLETQAQLAVTTLQAGTQVEIANAENATKVEIARAQGDAQVETAKLQSDTQIEAAKLQSDTQIEIANIEATNRANIATAQNTTQANIATAQNETQASIANAQWGTQASIATIEHGTKASIATSQNTTQASIANAQASAEAYKGYLADYSHWVTAVAQVYASLASSAYAAANVSLGASGSTSDSRSNSWSDDSSVSTNYNYSGQITE